MIAAHEQAVAEVDAPPRIQRGALRRLPVGNNVAAKVGPVAGGGPEPARELLADLLLESLVERLGPGTAAATSALPAGA